MHSAMRPTRTARPTQARHGPVRFARPSYFQALSGEEEEGEDDPPQPAGVGCILTGVAGCCNRGAACQWTCSPPRDLVVEALTVEGKSGAERQLCSLEQPAVGWRAIAAVVDSGAE